MQGPVAALLDHGKRLHLQHGPIDLIIGADGPGRRAAFAAAVQRFETILEELVAELPQLRRQLTGAPIAFRGPVAKRMARAIAPFAETFFITPMIAVAGSVADEMLQSLTATPGVGRAYVNNGGDIALHLEPSACFSVAMAEEHGARLGRLTIRHETPIRGIATSGAGGRSLSLGIAGSVTALARSAAEADAAATLIANAVDLPTHPQIERAPAISLQPDSDLGERLVVTRVPRLTIGEVGAALQRGKGLAQSMIAAGRISGAALFLQGACEIAGPAFTDLPQKLERADVPA